MSLTQSLSIAMAGLRANQLAMSLVSSNVANADTPGYVRKTVNQLAVVATEVGTSVAVTGINRELDAYVQRQLRTEISGSAFSNLRATMLGALQSVYGTPGSAGTLETAFNTFANSVQALSASPDSAAARASVISTAQSLTQQLNATTRGIQNLRASAESGIAASVNTVNSALAQIANINTQLLGKPTSTAASASLLDQRDLLVDQLAKELDIRVVASDNNQINVFTSSGVQLVGAEAARLSFNPQGTVNAGTLWNSDASQSGLGTITLNYPQGGSLDLIANNALRSGKLAAYVELRDHSLVEAQNQVDQFAAALASGLSDVTTAGTAVTAAPAAGFDIDLAAMKPGNVIHLTYTNATGTHNVSIVRVDDPSALPLSNSATNDPNDTVIGIDFSGGMASVATQLTTALGGGGLAFSATGSVLRVLDDGAAATSDVNAASVTTTTSVLNAGGTELPLFTDGSALFTGAFTASGSQVTGFAGRISLNAALVSDPSKLVAFTASTLSGDATRPNFIYDKLTSASYTYSPQTGIGTAAQPFTGSLLNFTQQFVALQGEKANYAQQIAEGQEVVVATLQQKFEETAGVNMDEEMAHLLALQNAYAANARVMSVVKDLFDVLFRA